MDWAYFELLSKSLSYSYQFHYLFFDILGSHHVIDGSGGDIGTLEGIVDITPEH